MTIPRIVGIKDQTLLMPMSRLLIALSLLALACLAEPNRARVAPMTHFLLRDAGSPTSRLFV